MAASFARTVPADAAALPGLMASAEQWLDEAGVPPSDAARLMIAFDEILSNIARHGAASLSLEAVVDDGRLTASIIDDGPAFNPLALAPPDTTLDIDERDIGGLGIHLVRQMMDDVAYVREKDCNRLIFAKTFRQ